ncbi:hypothetical protein OA868_00070 [Candidatus Pelagibacter sp.]|nr:hypothetical protein [Candidatus Pelagibacter sp.]
MSDLIRMSAEQMRRKGMLNAEQRRKREEEYNMKVESMSKHNVGGLYDIRAIKKSKQFEQQKNHYNIEQARSELEDLLQANRLYKFSFETEEFIKRISGREADSYTIRETGKFISDLINEIKTKYEVKE